MIDDGLHQRMVAHEREQRPLEEYDAHVVVLEGAGELELNSGADAHQGLPDESYRKAMVTLAHQLRIPHFFVRFAYTHTSEIVLLLQRTGEPIGEGMQAKVFDSARMWMRNWFSHDPFFRVRFVGLHDETHALEFFRWRQQQGLARTCFTCCFEQLRRDGIAYLDARRTAASLSIEEQMEYLASRDAPLLDVPQWLRHGSAWLSETKFLPYFNPQFQREEIAARTDFRVEHDVPWGDGFVGMIADELAPRKNPYRPDAPFDA